MNPFPIKARYQTTTFSADMEVNIILFRLHYIIYYILLCYAMLCYAMLCYALLCYVMLCYVMLFYIMLCYKLLRFLSLDVPPSLMLRAKNFVSYIPVDIWNSLHSKFVFLSDFLLVNFLSFNTV